MEFEHSVKLLIANHVQHIKEGEKKTASNLKPVHLRCCAPSDDFETVKKDPNPGHKSFHISYLFLLHLNLLRAREELSVYL